MANSKFSFDYKNLQDYMDKLNQVCNNQSKIQEVFEKCLYVVPEIVNPQITKAIKKHRRTGKTEKSIVTNPNVTWEGNYGYIKVGFDIGNGGYPSIFLMYGTPAHTPMNQYGRPKKSPSKNTYIKQDKSLYNALRGSATRKKILKQQQQIFETEINKLLQR